MKIHRATEFLIISHSYLSDYAIRKSMDKITSMDLFADRNLDEPVVIEIFSTINDLERYSYIQYDESLYNKLQDLVLIK